MIYGLIQRNISNERRNRTAVSLNDSFISCIFLLTQYLKLLHGQHCNQMSTVLQICQKTFSMYFFYPFPAVTDSWMLCRLLPVPPEFLCNVFTK